MMWLIISVSILFFIILFAVYFMAFYSNPLARIENPYDIPSSPQYRQGRERMRKLISDFLALPCEHIRIQSHDGLTLHARFYPGLPNAPVEILCHGYRGSASAVEAVKHSKIPILIIHGEDDRFVPCDMSREIRAANPNRVTLHTFPDASHGLSYIVDTPRYVRAVADFEDTLNLF